MFLYWLLGILGVTGGVIAARRIAGRRIPGASNPTGSGGGTVSSTKLTTASDDALGIDVSSAQGDIDWSQVKDGGISFVIVKLTEGASGVDGKASRNMQGARDNGILRGGYHFAHMQGDARQQAQFFSGKIKEFGGLDTPPVLDFEQVDSKTMLSPLSKAATIQWAKDFIDEMHNQGFPVVWLYSYPSYLLQLMPDLATSGLEKLADLWIADYGQTVNQTGNVGDGAIPVTHKSATYAAVKAMWPTWVMWQTHGNDELPKGSGRPRLPGIRTAIDRDRFNGTVAQLQGRLLGRLFS
jgi:GH25 family lysozyme M1 (1,4-beta-N-acetylmuramidase)